jgi:hypothetical protein
MGYPRCSLLSMHWFRSRPWIHASEEALARMSRTRCAQLRVGSGS